MSVDPVLSATPVQETSAAQPPLLLKKRRLPRAMRVAVSISKGAVGFFAFALIAMIGGAFGIGVWVGLNVEREPVVVERVVEREVPKPVAVATETPPVVVKEEPTPKPKLEVTIGPPEDTNAWSVQIGAFPDLGEAQASLDNQVAALASLPIYIVPAEIKDKGVWHRVRVGAFRSRAEAEKARLALPEVIAKQAMVVSYK